MYSHKFGLIAFAALLGCAANAATDAQPTVIKVLTSDVTVAADGSSSQIIHAELTANNDAAAMQLAQIRVPFNSAMQTFELVEAYTLKPGGAKIPADAGAVYEQSPQGAPVPLFTDQRVKVIVLPQFAAGDTAVYTVKFVAAHPYFAGQFFFGDVFPRSIA